jgi:magnesium-dependent phosphatase 1
MALSRTNEKCKLYKDCWIILHALRQLQEQDDNLKLGIASRTETPSWARELLNVLKISEWFPFQEIYPSNKVRHFEQLRNQSKVEYENMIFFDDEDRNITQVGNTLKVTSILVHRGITIESFLKGIEQYNKKF